MIVILEKYEHNHNFHQIVDFVEASHIRVRAQELQLSPITHPPTESLPIIIPTDTLLLRHYTRRARIAQSSALPPVADKPASLIGDELEINSLKARIKLLEDKDRGVADQSGDDALIKGRRLDEGEEATERVSDDTEEMAILLTSMDAASILTSRGVQVVPTAAEVATATISIPTGSGVVSTASPTIPTVAPIFTTTTDSTPYTRRKGKEKMVESDTPKKKKLQEQIDVHIMIDGLDMTNETVAKYLQEYQQFAIELPIGKRIELISDLVKYQDNYAKVLKYHTQQRKSITRKQQREFYTSVLRNQAGWKAKHFKGMTLEEIKEKFDPVWKQIQDFIPISSKSATSDKEKELWVELKRLFEPDVEDYLWTHTQNLIHALVEWKLYDTCGVHHVSTKDQDIFMLIEKDYPLRKGLVQHQVKGRIVGNKMHKEFSLPVMKFPLPEEVSTTAKKVPPAKEKRCYCCEVCTATKVNRKLSVKDTITGVNSYVTVMLS
nr:hypothetical protein [Tanacetum cinerariifolium]